MNVKLLIQEGSNPPREIERRLVPTGKVARLVVDKAFIGTVDASRLALQQSTYMKVRLPGQPEGNLFGYGFIPPEEPKGCKILFEYLMGGERISFEIEWV